MSASMTRDDSGDEHAGQAGAPADDNLARLRRAEAELEELRALVDARVDARVEAERQRLKEEMSKKGISFLLWSRCDPRRENAAAIQAAFDQFRSVGNHVEYRASLREINHVLSCAARDSDKVVSPATRRLHVIVDGPSGVGKTQLPFGVDLAALPAEIPPSLADSIRASADVSNLPTLPSLLKQGEHFSCVHPAQLDLEDGASKRPWSMLYVNLSAGSAADTGSAQKVYKAFDAVSVAVNKALRRDVEKVRDFILRPARTESTTAHKRTMSGLRGFIEDVDLATPALLIALDSYVRGKTSTSGHAGTLASECLSALKDLEVVGEYFVPDLRFESVRAVYPLLHTVVITDEASFRTRSSSVRDADSKYDTNLMDKIRLWKQMIVQLGGIPVLQGTNASAEDFTSAALGSRQESDYVDLAAQVPSAYAIFKLPAPSRGSLLCSIPEVEAQRLADLDARVDALILRERPLVARECYRVIAALIEADRVPKKGILPDGKMPTELYVRLIAHISVKTVEWKRERMQGQLWSVAGLAMDLCCSLQPSFVDSHFFNIKSSLQCPYLELWHLEGSAGEEVHRTQLQWASPAAGFGADSASSGRDKERLPLKLSSTAPALNTEHLLHMALLIPMNRFKLRNKRQSVAALAYDLRESAMLRKMLSFAGESPKSDGMYLEVLTLSALSSATRSCVFSCGGAAKQDVVKKSVPRCLFPDEMIPEIAERARRGVPLGDVILHLAAELTDDSEETRPRLELAAYTWDCELGRKMIPSQLQDLKLYLLGGTGLEESPEAAKILHVQFMKTFRLKDKERADGAFLLPAEASAERGTEQPATPSLPAGTEPASFFSADPPPAKETASETAISPTLEAGAPAVFPAAAAAAEDASPPPKRSRTGPKESASETATSPTFEAGAPASLAATSGAAALEARALAEDTRVYHVMTEAKDWKKLDGKGLADVVKRFHKRVVASSDPLVLFLFSSSFASPTGFASENVQSLRKSCGCDLSNLDPPPGSTEEKEKGSPKDWPGAGAQERKPRIAIVKLTPAPDAAAESSAAAAAAAGATSPRPRVVKLEPFAPEAWFDVMHWYEKARRVAFPSILRASGKGLYAHLRMPDNMHRTTSLVILVPVSEFSPKFTTKGM